MTIPLWSELSKHDQDRLTNQAFSVQELIDMGDTGRDVARMIAVEMYSLSRAIIKASQL